MELAGTWRALIADDELRRTWLDRSDDDDWEPVDVPGHWRSTPAFADTDGPAALPHPVRPRAPAARGAALVGSLDGLFYQGDVWLDGAYVGDTEGYFFPHDFEVTEALADVADGARPRRRGRPAPGPTTSPRSATSPGCSSTGTASIPTGTQAASGDRCAWRRTGPVRIRRLRVVCREADEDARRRGVPRRARRRRARRRSRCARRWAARTRVDERTLAAGANQRRVDGDRSGGRRCGGRTPSATSRCTT